MFLTNYGLIHASLDEIDKVALCRYKVIELSDIYRFTHKFDFCRVICCLFIQYLW